MNIQLPSSINPNDLIAALGAGAQGIKGNPDPNDPMADYYANTLRNFRDEVVRESRKPA